MLYYYARKIIVTCYGLFKAGLELGIWGLFIGKCLWSSQYRVKFNLKFLVTHGDRFMLCI